MKLTILGSAAAEGIPGIWCECKICRYARIHGGYDIRRRTAYLLDDDTLIDFGPDIFAQILASGSDPLKIRRILISHSHEDHFQPLDLINRRKSFCRVTRKINLIASKEILGRLVDSGRLYTPDELQLDITDAVPGRRCRSGNLDILMLKANHMEDTHENALNYLLKRDGRTLLIANDTGWYSDAAWNLLNHIHLDAIVIDCTFALSPDNSIAERNHFGAEGLLRFRNELARRGVITEKTRVLANHFSHNGLPLHHELEAWFKPHGVIPAYDGLKLMI